MNDIREVGRFVYIPSIDNYGMLCANCSKPLANHEGGLYCELDLYGNPLRDERDD